MRSPRERSDDAVSEIIGMLLIFSITASIVSGLVIWYIPYTGQQYENQFVSSDQQAFSSFASQLSSSSLQNGSTVSQTFPMGIQGAFFTNPQQTSLSYSSNFNISIKYDVSVGISYSGNTPVNQLSNKIVGEVKVGQNPDAVAVDTVNNLIFEVNSNYTNVLYGHLDPGNVTVISGADNAPVKSIPLIGYPTGITFDSKDNLIFITEGNLSTLTLQSGDTSFNNGSIQVISGSSLSVVKTLNYSSLPYDITYVPYLNEVMFTISYPLSISGGGAVVSLNVSTYAESGFIQLAKPGSNTIPSSISYDPANGYVYVALGTVVAVVNPITDENVSTIAINTPWSLAFDTSNGNIFSTSSYLGYYDCPSTSSPSPGLIVINGTNNKIIGDYGACCPPSYYNMYTPTSIVFDSANHLLYMADTQNSNIWVINGKTGAPLTTISGYPSGSGPGNGPNAIAYDPLNGAIYVPNWNSGTMTVISGDTVLSSGSSLFGQSFKPVGDLKGNGEISSFAPNSFIPSQYISIQDGFVTEMYSGNSFGQSLTGTPISISEINHNSALLSLSLNVLDFSGSYFSTSQTGNYLLSGSVQQRNSAEVQSGELINFVSGGTEYSANITDIIVNNVSVTINSPSVALWNYTFYREYNNSFAHFNSNPNGTTWSFSYPLPITVRVFKDSMIISTFTPTKITTPLAIEAFSYQYLQLLLNE